MITELDLVDLRARVEETTWRIDISKAVMVDLLDRLEAAEKARDEAQAAIARVRSLNHRCRSYGFVLAALDGPGATP